MAGLNLRHLYKIYPNGTKAVTDFNMEIFDKEFIVFVGPSGCGKSTTLRMIAGLEEISAGELEIGDRIVNDVDAKERDTAMVFQNYALYPHMTVFENMAFPLKMSKMPKEEIIDKVEATAKILGLSEYLKVKPSEMSGGQRQRVALGRAIVREPKVFLLDEPLSNLDAKLRTQMRAEITKLHKRLQTTFIYVTHDQTEAMTMGDRIVVMKEGVIQQIDTPTNLYLYPNNKFVAGFIGTPPMNFFEVVACVKDAKAEITFSSGTIEIDAEEIVKLQHNYKKGVALYMGVRPENIKICSSKTLRSLECKVKQVEILGSDALLYCDFGQKDADVYADGSFDAVIKTEGFTPVKEGDLINVEFDFKYVHFFDKETELCVSNRLVENNVIEVSVTGGTINFAGYSQKLPPAVSLRDGNYICTIPTDAVRLQKGNSYKVTSCEQIGDKYLCRLGISEILFALCDSRPDGKTDFSLDIKKLTFAQNNEVVQPALNLDAWLSGNLEKVKIAKNEYGMKFQIVAHLGEQSFVCPYQMQKRLLAASDRKIFKTPMRFRFNADDILSDGTLIASVIEKYDYSERLYALCQVNGEQVVLPITKDTSDIFTFGLDVSAVAVYEADSGIRL